MKIILSLLLYTPVLFASSSATFPMSIKCIPWGYDSTGEDLSHLDITIDKNGNYQAKEEWKIPGALTHSGKAFAGKANPKWVKIELLQEDTYFPKTRGFIKIQLLPRHESFITSYKALFSNDETAYLWESKKTICSVK